MGNCCAACCFALCTCFTCCCWGSQSTRVQLSSESRSLSDHQERTIPQEPEGANACCPGFCLSFLVFIPLLVLSHAHHSDIHIPFVCPERSCHHMSTLRILLISSIPFWFCFFCRRRQRRNLLYPVDDNDNRQEDVERPPPTAPAYYNYESIVDDDEVEHDRPPPSAPLEPSAPVERHLQPAIIVQKDDHDYGSIPLIPEKYVTPIPAPSVREG